MTQEEEMIKKVKSHATFMVTVDKRKKEKKFFKGNSCNSHNMKKSRKPLQQVSVSIPNGPKNEGLKRMCNFCQLFRHKKVDCR